jgi:ubiquinol oxidase
VTHLPFFMVLHFNAQQERMHLMTFMTLRHPSLFFRAIVLGAQGVFYNLFCMSVYILGLLRSHGGPIVLSYLISPRTCHRFVGHLEEEAVRT